MASIKDLKRMCESNGDYCTNCPLYKPNSLCTPHLLLDNADGIVDKWVQEHPVKTYADDFFEKFPDAPRDSGGTPAVCWQNVYGDGQYCAYDMCPECWNREMEE